MTCAWIFGDVERGQPVRRCPMPQDDGGPYCLFHRKRSRRKPTRTDLRQIEGIDEVVS